MKFLNKETKTVLEVTDKNRIEKFKGYPDKFIVIEDEKVSIEKVSIEKMTKENLLILAKERGIEISKDEKVNEIRKILKEAESKVEE